MRDASVVNDPSDGRERPVADALLAYSDAPSGQHPRLVVRPATFTAYRGAQVALRGAIVDDGDHLVRAADVAPLDTDPAPGTHVAIVRERGGTLTASVPYRTVDRVAALAIVPDRPNPARGVQAAAHRERGRRARRAGRARRRAGALDVRRADGERRARRLRHAGRQRDRYGDARRGDRDDADPRRRTRRRRAGLRGNPARLRFYRHRRARRTRTRRSRCPTNRRG